MAAIALSSSLRRASVMASAAASAVGKCRCLAGWAAVPRAWGTGEGWACLRFGAQRKASGRDQGEQQM